MICIEVNLTKMFNFVFLPLHTYFVLSWSFLLASAAYSDLEKTNILTFFNSRRGSVLPAPSGMRKLVSELRSFTLFVL